MPEEAPRVPRFDELINPTLKATHELGGSASVEELVEKVIEALSLSKEGVEKQHPGRTNQTELEYRLAWARTYLKKFGLITISSRGVWTLTPEGRQTMAVNPKEVVQFVRRQGPKKSRKQTTRTADEETEEDETGPDDEIATWKIQLLDILQKMPPDSFERLCMRLLRESGFTEVEVTGRSGDGGIDGRGVIRLAGLLSVPVIFQCKRYKRSVPPKEIRDFRGAMTGRTNGGFFLTTGRFTREARLEAKREGAPLIDLIDGDLLMEKLKELGLGVNTKETVVIDGEWFSAI